MQACKQGAALRFGALSADGVGPTDIRQHVREGGHGSRGLRGPAFPSLPPWGSRRKPSGFLRSGQAAPRNSIKRPERLPQQLHQQVVDAAHICARLVDAVALCQRRLVEQDRNQVAEAVFVRFGVEAQDEGMVGVDLEVRLALRGRLAGGLHDAAHLQAHVVFAKHQTRGGVCEAPGAAHFIHPFAKRLLDAADKGIVFVVPGFVLVLLLFRRLVGLVEIEFAARDVLKLLAVELPRKRHEPLVNAVREQQHLDASRPEHLQMRALPRRAVGLRDQVVDAILSLAHAPHIVGEGDALARLVVVGGGEAQQLQERLLVGEVLGHAFLQHLAELVPELAVLLGFQLGQGVEHPPRQGVADGAGALVRLQDFAGDVERQVAAIHHAAHEAQIQRQEFVRLVHDEHALDVELDAARRFPVPQVVRGALGDIEEAGVFELALHPVVAPNQRILEVVRDVAIELAVFVVLDLAAGASPQRLGGVDALELRPVVALLRHLDRHADVVRILADDGAQAEAVGELPGIVPERQGHLGATGKSLGVLDREALLAPGRPAHTGLLPCPPGEHLHLLGNDEGAVEANPELADEGGVALLIAREPFQELRRAGLGDGAEIGHNLLPRHADAVVGHGEGSTVLVEFDADAEVRVARQQRIVRKRLEAELVDRIGGVGDQLAQEDLPVRIQGVDHQLQELLRLGLKAEGFGGAGFGHGSWPNGLTQARQMGANACDSRGDSILFGRLGRRGARSHCRRSI